MPYWSRKAGALRTHPFRFLSLAVFVPAALILFSGAMSGAQEQPAASALRGYVSPPPGEGYPTQPVPPPVQVSPRATPRVDRGSAEQEDSGGLESKGKSPKRLPPTVAPPPEIPYAVNTAMLGLKVVHVEVVPRLSFAAGAQRKVLEPGPGKNLAVATLEGKTLAAIKMPMAIRDFSAFWLEEHVRTVYGKKVPERSVQTAKAVALETPRGWLLEGEGLPDSALFYFMDPGPVSLRVGFVLPEGVRRFGVRYPSVAEGDAMIASDAPPAGK